MNQVVSDASLMAEAQQGDAAAFGEIYNRFAVRALGMARTICRDQRSAEDAVQEAFLSIWRGRASYRESAGPLAPWLLTIVRRRAIDAARRDQTHASEHSDTATPVPRATGSLARGAEARDGRADMRDALMELPGPQREVIALAFYGEMTHKEISEHLSLPEGTVKGRIRLGLRKLADDGERG